VAAVLSLTWLLRQAVAQILDVAFVKRAFDRLDVTIAYAIGTVAAYWLVERTAAFFA
jgi:multidrug transporter EmrE-like cation transporter